MRNAHAPATIAILTDNPHPVAGSALTGTICLDVTSSSTTSIPATSSFCLSFHGEEVSTVASYMARADATFKEESKCNIISSTISDFATFASEGRDDPNARLSAGQYEVPFIIDLPPWLPPTMLCKGQEGSSCAIRYTLEASWCEMILDLLVERVTSWPDQLPRKKFLYWASQKAMLLPNFRGHCQSKRKHARKNTNCFPSFVCHVGRYEFEENYCHGHQLDLAINHSVSAWMYGMIRRTGKSMRLMSNFEKTFVGWLAPRVPCLAKKG